MKKESIIIKCDKCGKVPPIDKEKSNKNWTVYKTDKPCECGGKFRPDFK